MQFNQKVMAGVALCSLLIFEVALVGWLRYERTATCECNAPVPVAPAQATVAQAVPGVSRDEDLESATSVVADHRQCHWVFDGYEPSEWEAWWAANIVSLRDKECAMIQTNQTEWDLADRMISRIVSLSSRTKENTSVPADHPDNALLSRMVYREHCDREKTEHVRVQLIEPLVWILRDPIGAFPCGPTKFPAKSPIYHRKIVQSKRFVLLGPFAPWAEAPVTQNTTWNLGGFDPLGYHSKRNLLMDLGASRYTSWRKAASDLELDAQTIGAKWFVDKLAQINVEFSRVVCFEAQLWKPHHVFDGVPTPLLYRYQYYNRPVSEDPTQQFYPWRFLEDLVEPDSYVVVKLDIDALQIEKALLESLISKYSSLVSEFTFEHHTRQPEMMKRGWGSKNLGGHTPDQPLSQSYVYFTKLRTLGVRAHSWP